MTELFELLKASLFTDAPLELPNWEEVFIEMRKQAVAVLPGDWLERHQIAPPWRTYCALEQGQWSRVMYVQNQLIRLLEDNHIPSVVIKGAAAAMYYPRPSLRSMGDVDVLVKREDHERAAALLEKNGYELIVEKELSHHHYNYLKNNISIELHNRLAVVDDEDETLLMLFEDGIENREWKVTEGNKFPVLPPLLNGLVLIFHINQHLRSGLGLRQIIDWMMYVNSLTAAQWENLSVFLEYTGMYRLALITTAMCQKYLGLTCSFLDSETVDSKVCDELMDFILEEGNFGRKAGMDGKAASFALSSSEKGGFFRRLQAGGLCQWEAARKHLLLRPFAWIYQACRILCILVAARKTPKDLLRYKEKGDEQRELLGKLGLEVNRTIKDVEKGNSAE